MQTEKVEKMWWFQTCFFSIIYGIILRIDHQPENIFYYLIYRISYFNISINVIYGLDNAILWMDDYLGVNIPRHVESQWFPVQKP
jgi:hypothetical protein